MRARVCVLHYHLIFSYLFVCCSLLRIATSSSPLQISDFPPHTHLLPPPPDQPPLPRGEAGRRRTWRPLPGEERASPSRPRRQRQRHGEQVGAEGGEAGRSPPPARHASALRSTQRGAAAGRRRRRGRYRGRAAAGARREGWGP